ncbi:MAG: polysaccharide deacetylase family protein [Planctomycetes bacterium]|nr:polysaccharide deacetylase family protein [Planctomycetota bacterium]
MKFAAININLDSLNEAYGFPDGYSDPTFTSVMDRFLRFAEKYNFKYSIYIIGRDLEKDENREAVSRWAKLGHEIGNHSWSHYLSLGAMRKKELFDEVKRSHDAIANCVGYEPRGFIAPAWSTSHRLRDVLMELGYEYDTSDWPSILMYPALAKMLVNHFGSPSFRKILNRRDLHYPILASRNARVIRKGERRLVSLPLPTNRWRISVWHTTSFMFGWKWHLRLLKSCLNDVEFFYYLLHPADLTEAKDISPERRMNFERMQFDLTVKEKLLDDSLSEVASAGRQFVTMRELAKAVAERASCKRD